MPNWAFFCCCVWQIFIKMYAMGRLFFILMFMLVGITAESNAATGRLSKYVDPQSYAYMYPYLSNKMRTELNPGTTVSMVNNPIDVVVRTKQMSEPRRVVPRTPKVSTARATTTSSQTNDTQPRRVVPRTGTTTARAATNNQTNRTVRPRATSRTDPDANVQLAATTINLNNEGVSSARCLADYMQCMDGYCVHDNAAYNRCYCSAKLTQIDSQYQNKINDLIAQIIRLRNSGPWTDEEMNEYWMERIGNYVGENSWENLDNALNIEWPSAEARITGQNAFLVGHEYCVQHLRACSYMASNMRDAYRSKISRDCVSYEKVLMKIKNAAEAVVQYYSE